MNKCHQATEAEWETGEQRCMGTLNHKFSLNPDSNCMIKPKTKDGIQTSVLCQD